MEMKHKGRFNEENIPDLQVGAFKNIEKVTRYEENIENDMYIYCNTSESIECAN